MAPPGISFEVAPPALASDPNRMDIAMFVGLLPLSKGGEAARAAVAKRLAAGGWAGRADASLRDVPVRVRSIEEVEALWDTGGRLDRVARVRGSGLEDLVSIAPWDSILTVNVDGVDTAMSIAEGVVAREELLAALSGIDGVDVQLDAPQSDGSAGLVFTRTATGAGAITVYANPSLGFGVASRDATSVTGCPTGAALRAFFAAGGREAMVVAMGDPASLFPDESARVSAIQRLIPGFGPGAVSLTDLAGGVLPNLPGAFPPREPWHGLAHLHGLDDVAMVLMPDLPELCAAIPAVAATPAEPIRPPAKFTVCAPIDPTPLDGQSAAGMPARADETGLALWSKITAWAVSETARITPEAMVIAATPLPEDGASTSITERLDSGNDGQGLAHPQLQLTAPWVVSPLFHDMPASAAPADGMLAGTIAAKTLEQGAWRTVAGTTWPWATTLLGDALDLTPDRAPALSVIGRSKRGVEVLSDRTTDQIRYAQANTRRLMALVLRAARHRGEGMVFEANGPLLWRDVTVTMTTLLRSLQTQGALASLPEAEAFTVRCGPDTMTQQDIDQGRVIAEVSLRPAHALERIEIRFVARGGALVSGEAA